MDRHRRIDGGVSMDTCPSRDPRRRSAIEPHRRARLESSVVAAQIKAQTQCIAIVVADGTLRLPGRKRAERHELGHDHRGRLARARPSHVDRRFDRDACENLKPSVQQVDAIAMLRDNATVLPNYFP
jgi:hypothetical protein